MFEIHIPCEKRASARVLDDFVLSRPFRSPLGVSTRRCSGRAGSSKHKCLAALETSTNHAIWAARWGEGGVKPVNTQTRAAFLAAEGGALDFGGRLWRDCGADTLSLWLAHRYREPFDMGCAAGVRIKKTAQNSNSGAVFNTEGIREGCSGKNL